MRHLVSVGRIKGAESVAAAVAYELGMEVKLEAVLSAASRALISVYCVGVVTANWSRAAPLFVAAAARLSKCPSNWSM